MYPGTLGTAVAPLLSRLPQKTLGPRAPSSSQRRRALFGSLASQPSPAQLPPPKPCLGFFSQPSSAPVRRATDQRQQIPPTPSRISRQPLILPPINPICAGLRVPWSIAFPCQSHRDASLLDDSFLSVLLDLRHVAPLFILVRGSWTLLPRPPSIAFVFAVEARSTASTQTLPTARASCLGFTLTSTALSPLILTATRHLAPPRDYRPRVPLHRRGFTIPSAQNQIWMRCSSN